MNVYVLQHVHELDEPGVRPFPSTVRPVRQRTHAYLGRRSVAIAAPATEAPTWPNA